MVAWYRYIGHFPEPEPAVFLALREIARNRARFAMLGGAVGLLVVLLLFFQSVAAALTGALTGAVANQTAEVLVYDARARQNPAVSRLPATTVDEVAGVDGVAAAGGVAQAFVTATGPGGERVDAVLVAIEPGAPGTPTRITGDLPTTGEALAAGSGFDPAFPVDASVTLASGAVELEVVGQAADASANASPTLYVDHATFVRALSALGHGAAGSDGGSPALSWVGATSTDGTRPTELADRIEAEVDGVEALARPDAVAALPGVSTVTQSFGILYGLLFVVVTIVTGVFFLILTVQKRDALVLLRAVGATRADVVVPVLVQVVVVMGLGAATGTAVTAGLLRAARDVFGTSLDPATTVVSAALMLALGVLAALGSVRRVLRIDPAEATTTADLT